MRPKSRHKVISEEMEYLGLILIIETSIVININGKLVNGYASKKVKEIYIKDTEESVETLFMN